MLRELRTAALRRPRAHAPAGRRAPVFAIGWRQHDLAGPFDIGAGQEMAVELVEQLARLQDVRKLDPFAELLVDDEPKRTARPLTTAFAFGRAAMPPAHALRINAVRRPCS